MIANLTLDRPFDRAIARLARVRETYRDVLPMAVAEEIGSIIVMLEDARKAEDIMSVPMTRDEVRGYRAGVMARIARTAVERNAAGLRPEADRIPRKGQGADAHRPA